MRREEAPFRTLSTFDICIYATRHHFALHRTEGDRYDYLKGEF